MGFAYPFNYSDVRQQISHIEHNSRITGIDAYFQGDMIVWSTQFNPGGIFYGKLHDRERRQSNSGLIVSDQNQSSHNTNLLYFSFLIVYNIIMSITLKCLPENNFIQMVYMSSKAFPFKTDRPVWVSKRTQL